MENVSLPLPVLGALYSTIIAQGPIDEQSPPLTIFVREDFVQFMACLQDQSLSFQADNCLPRSKWSGMWNAIKVPGQAVHQLYIGWGLYRHRPMQGLVHVAYDKKEIYLKFKNHVLTAPRTSGIYSVPKLAYDSEQTIFIPTMPYTYSYSNPGQLEHFKEVMKHVGIYNAERMTLVDLHVGSITEQVDTPRRGGVFVPKPESTFGQFGNRKLLP